MRTIEEFDAFYSNKLYSTLVDLEGLRMKIVRFNVKVLLLFLLLVTVIVLTGMADHLTSGIKLIIGGGVLAGFLAYVVPNGLRVHQYKFKERFKMEVIQRIIHFISEDLRYDMQQFISKDEFKRSRLFLQSIDRYKGDDFVEGVIDKTRFRFSEIHAEYRVQSKNSSSYHTIFKGLFFSADFNKSFEGSTVLTPNSLGGGKRFLKRMAGLARREKYVELEDPTFNGLFNCYSDNDIKARYILSPALMSRIVDFRAKHPKNGIAISFVDEKVFVAVSHRKALFEVNSWSTLLDPHLARTYFLDVKLAVDIVHDLNLNTRIWSKE